ncbi:MAG: cobyric acid synthase, partial [Methanomassiliicoccales archaeon]
MDTVSAVPERARIIQVLGTSSNCGKTTIAAALCRSFSSRGYSVAPFKAINMSLNSIAIQPGAEISRSVWLQAKAARTEPVKEMNPFLLKPEGGGKVQVISLGKSMGVMRYSEMRGYLAANAGRIIDASIRKLAKSYDLIVSEGAGSPAEINFDGQDFANAYVPTRYDAPCILVGDIDRGGVFASLYGTLELMPAAENVKWLLINKMRGNRRLLDRGIRSMEILTGKKVVGVMPFVHNLRLPGEDGLDYTASHVSRASVAVVRYPYMENYSDVDPLIMSNVAFCYVDESNASALNDASVIILPGSKNVPRDLDYLKKSGLGKLIIEKAGKGCRILGICGGYQILCTSIRLRSAGGLSEIRGLGILENSVTYSTTKKVREVEYSFVDKRT